MAPGIPGPGDVARADLSALSNPGTPVEPGDFGLLGDISRNHSTPLIPPSRTAKDPDATKVARMCAADAFAREDSRLAEAEAIGFQDICTFLGAEERRTEAGRTPPAGPLGPSTTERATARVEATTAALTRDLESAGSSKQTIDTFREAGRQLREEAGARARIIDAADNPGLVLDALTDNVKRLAEGVRRDLNAAPMAFRKLGSFSLPLAEMVGAETLADVTEVNRQVLAAAVIDGRIARDPDRVLARFEADGYKNAGLPKVTLAVLRDKAERESETRRQAQADARETERTRFIGDLDRRVETGRRAPARSRPCARMAQSAPPLARGWFRGPSFARPRSGARPRVANKSRRSPGAKPTPRIPPIPPTGERSRITTNPPCRPSLPAGAASRMPARRKATNAWPIE